MNLELKLLLVIGGETFWRGEPAAEAGMDRVQADTGCSVLSWTLLRWLIRFNKLAWIPVFKQRLPCNKSQNHISVVVPLRHLEKIGSWSLVQGSVLLTSQQIRLQPFVQLRLKQMPFSWPKMGSMVFTMPIRKRCFSCEIWGIDSPWCDQQRSSHHGLNSLYSLHGQRHWLGCL